MKKIAPPKSNSSNPSKYPKLIIESITSDSENVLNGERYEMGNVFVLFPFVNRNDLPYLMIRHVCPFKRLVDNGTGYNVEFCEVGAMIYSSDIRYS